MASINFSKKGNLFEGTFQVNGDFGLQIEGAQVGNITLSIKLPEADNYVPAGVFAGRSYICQGCSFDSYPLDVKVQTTFNPTVAIYQE